MLHVRGSLVNKEGSTSLLVVGFLVIFFPFPTSQPRARAAGSSQPQSMTHPGSLPWLLFLTTLPIHANLTGRSPFASPIRVQNKSHRSWNSYRDSRLTPRPPRCLQGTAVFPATIQSETDLGSTPGVDRRESGGQPRRDRPARLNCVRRPEIFSSSGRPCINCTTKALLSMEPPGTMSFGRVICSR